MSSAPPAVSVPKPLPNSSHQAHMYAIGFGTFATSEENVYDSIKAGFRLIDCARAYENEKAVGNAIHRAISEGIVKRSDLFIVSKVWNSDHDPKYVKMSAEESIEELQCEGYLDLLLIHWPVAHVHEGSDEKKGPEKMADIPLIDTWRAFEQLQKDGRVRDIGVSNYTIQELEDLLKEAAIKPVVNQVELHPALPQDALRAFHEKNGIVTMAYSTFAVSPMEPDVNKSLLKNKQVIEIAKEEYGCKSLEEAEPLVPKMIISWGTQVGTVPLVKSSTPARIAQNAAIPFGGLSEATLQKLKTFGETTKMRVVNPNEFRAEYGPFFKD